MPCNARAVAARVIEARYTVPFLAHATMEPPNCTVALEDGRARVIASVQSPGSAASQVNALTGIPVQHIQVELPRAIAAATGKRIRRLPMGDQLA
jgi:isoquinoline 1-oxidoreductase subunit beta